MATTAGYLSPETPQSNKYGRGISNGHHSGYDADQPVASSPLMRDDSFTPRDPFRSSTASRNSSARLSRDLDNWRASLALSAVGTEFEDEEKDGGVESNHNPSLASRPHTSPAERKEVTDDNSYSSQQLDDILKSAKDQLSRLEGKVKGARYSLAEMPSLASYSPTSTSSSPIKATHDKAASADDTSRLNRSPRINFAPPRTNSTFSTDKERTASRHARNYSDTSVPSPQGQVPKGSIAAQPVAKREISRHLSLRETPTYRNSKAVSDLDTVAEEATSPRKSVHIIPEDSTARHSQLSSLRRDAEVVRERLSVIQSGVLSAVEKRRSWRNGTSSVRPEEIEQIKEVNQLERLLQRQEAFLRELEQPDAGDDRGEDEDNEWREIERHKDYNNRNFQDLTDEDDVDSDHDTEHRSILEETFLEGELEPDFGESHEDRADAFDYEHFIIHSVLNTAKLPTPRSRTSSSASSDTVSTPRNRAADDFDDEDNGPNQSIDAMSPSNPSNASFATAQSFMDPDSDSEFEHDEQTSDDERELLTKNGAWPVPPSVATTSPTEESARNLATSTGSNTNPTARSTGARPASLVYSAVVNQLPGGPQVSEDDETLIRSLAEAMRHACKELQRHSAEPARADDWRYRLEEARRLLSGESEIF